MKLFLFNWPSPPTLVTTIFVLIQLHCSYGSFGQGNAEIVLKEGGVLKVKVLTTDSVYVKYKRLDNLQGPDYYIYQEDLVSPYFIKKSNEVTSESNNVSVPSEKKNTFLQLVGTSFIIIATILILRPR
jgi:hypothetical protein